MMTTLQDHPIAAQFPLLQGKEFEELVQSMKLHGFLDEHPILLHDGKILDGRNRYRAAQAAGVEPKTKEVSGVFDPWDLVWRENATRRHIDAGQRAALFLAFTEGSTQWFAAHAKGAPPAKTAGSKSDRTNSRAKSIAAGAGVSRATIERAIELKKKNPEAFEKVSRGEVKLNRALVSTKKNEIAQRLESKPLPLPTARHDVIVADPPWPYETLPENRDERGGVGYPTMSIEEICAVRVADVAEDNCILWLWVTNAFMREAFRVLDAWGFQEKTILTWDKQKIGTGHWLRNSTEHCILAVRGKPTVQLTNEPTLLVAPRRQHSRKPDAFFSMVEKLCPGTKIELFARQARKGWNVWGAETGKFRGTRA